MEQKCFTNNHHNALLRKSFNDFWKSWRFKFRNNTNHNTLHISALISDAHISAKLADYLSGLCWPDNTTQCKELNEHYLNMRSTCIGYHFLDSHLFYVETVDNIMSKLKGDKAAGRDEIASEHLLFSHPALTLVLTRLLDIMLLNGFLPDNFCASFTVPIRKTDNK